MDFTLEEHQQDLRGLAAELLAREAGTQRVEAHERSGATYDVPAWKAMAQAGLLGLVVPEAEGGQGFGLLELAVLLEEVGRRTAPVPVMSCLALGVLPLARWGTPNQRRELLPSVIEGEAVLSAAVHEPGRPHAGAWGGRGELATAAQQVGEGFVLDGAKTRVPYVAEAAYILVPARIGERGSGVFLVDPNAAGVTVTPGYTSHGHPEARVELRGVRVPETSLLGDGGVGAGWLADHALAAACVLGSGALAEALRLTTEHVRTREQFGRQIAAFQGVALQVADVYIEARALEAAAWSACWRLATGRDHRAALAVAAHRLTEGAVSALHTCQHLHGGLGVDVTYPLHRYFGWVKQLAHTCGGPDHQLDQLGAAIA